MNKKALPGTVILPYGAGITPQYGRSSLRGRPALPAPDTLRYGAGKTATILYQKYKHYTRK